MKKKYTYHLIIAGQGGLITITRADLLQRIQREGWFDPQDVLTDWEFKTGTYHVGGKYSVIVESK